jgi:hypothetical protein
VSRLEVTAGDGVGAEAVIDVRDPDGLEGDVPYLSTIEFRPVRILIGDPPKTLFEGILGEAEYRQKVSALATATTFRARDLWAFAEAYAAPDAIPFDGETLEGAAGKLARAAGLNLYAPATGFTIPVLGLDYRGNFQAELEVGETIADGLGRLKETYAGNFYLFTKPTASGYRLEFYEVGATAPAATLYSRTADAPGGDVRQTYSGLRLTTVPIAVTQLWITGRDPHTDKPIQARVRHAEPIEDVELPVADRTPLWSGFPRRYGFGDPALTSVKLLERAAEKLAKRLFRSRVMAEFEGHLLVKADGYPVWRGDVVRLVDSGYYRNVRLNSVSVTFRKTSDNFTAGAANFALERVSYAGEVIEEGDLP